MPEATESHVWPSPAQFLCQPCLAKAFEGLFLLLPLDLAITLLRFHAEPDWQLPGLFEHCNRRGNNSLWAIEERGGTNINIAIQRMCCWSTCCWRNWEPLWLDFGGDANFQQVELKRVEKIVETEGAVLGYGQRAGDVWEPGVRKGPKGSGDEPR